MIRGMEVISVKEDFVFLYGTAKTAAKIVVGHMAEDGVEVRTRVEGAVLQVFHRCAVKRVRSGLQDGIRNGANGTSELCIVIIGGNVNRLNRLGRGNQNLQQTCTFIVVDSFDLIAVAFAWLAIDLCLQCALRIEELRVLKCRRRRARYQIQQ